MAAIAYLKPLSENAQRNFDSLELKGTTQEVIACPQCRAEYVLVYPAITDAETLARYRANVKACMHNCGSHKGMIRFDFRTSSQEESPIGIPFVASRSCASEYRRVAPISGG
jgi:hypothetical protein